MQASEGVVIAALYRAATINMLEETRHLIKSSVPGVWSKKLDDIEVVNVQHSQRLHQDS